jgi:prepilin-type N-terminal cleavage/methylation domain-containing protein
MTRRKGFTLIELLVVISIIALLMSILMPALSRVKKQAQSVACMSRLKSWGLIYKLYTDDYQGSFPIGWGASDMTQWMVTLRPWYHNEWKMLCARRRPGSSSAPATPPPGRPGRGHRRFAYWQLRQ